MVNRASLAARIARLSAGAKWADPRGKLPIVVEPEKVNSDDMQKLRQQGWVVVTFEQCAELMV